MPDQKTAVFACDVDGLLLDESYLTDMRDFLVPWRTLIHNQWTASVGAVFHDKTPEGHAIKQVIAEIKTLCLDPAFVKYNQNIDGYRPLTTSFLTKASAAASSQSEYDIKRFSDLQSLINALAGFTKAINNYEATYEESIKRKDELQKSIEEQQQLLTQLNTNSEVLDDAEKKKLKVQITRCEHEIARQRRLLETQNKKIDDYAEVRDFHVANKSRLVTKLNELSDTLEATQPVLYHQLESQFFPWYQQKAREFLMKADLFLRMHILTGLGQHALLNQLCAFLTENQVSRLILVCGSNRSSHLLNIANSYGNKSTFSGFSLFFLIQHYLASQLPETVVDYNPVVLSDWDYTTDVGAISELPTYQLYGQITDPRMRYQSTLLASLVNPHHYSLGLNDSAIYEQLLNLPKEVIFKNGLDSRCIGSSKALLLQAHEAVCKLLEADLYVFADDIEAYLAEANQLIKRPKLLLESSNARNAAYLHTLDEPLARSVFATSNTPSAVMRIIEKYQWSEQESTLVAEYITQADDYSLLRLLVDKNAHANLRGNATIHEALFTRLSRINYAQESLQNEFLGNLTAVEIEALEKYFKESQPRPMRGTAIFQPVPPLLTKEAYPGLDTLITQAKQVLSYSKKVQKLITDVLLPNGHDEAWVQFQFALLNALQSTRFAVLLTNHKQEQALLRYVEGMLGNTACDRGDYQHAIALINDTPAVFSSQNDASTYLDNVLKGLPGFELEIEHSPVLVL